MLLYYTDLISNDLRSHAKKVKNINSEIITYYINKESGWSTLDLYQNPSVLRNYYSINKAKHSQEDELFIRSIFNKLDLIIDLDFEEMSHNNGSLIDIYSVNSSSSFVSNVSNQIVLGQVIPQTSQLGSWWDILWKETNTKDTLQSSEKNTIIHEIGHTLGLSHPQNDPFNPSWNTDDTVMSYNQSDNGWDFWFSRKDLDALISIWGREDDEKILTFQGQSSEYKFLQFTNKNLGIKSNIGNESIDGINTLIFEDRSYNVDEDIKATFDQVKGVDHITGKIFRLYNSALDRFPDSSGLNYWITKNLSGENTYRQTCASFIISDEFKLKYGNLETNQEYLTTLYSNILERSPDQNGFNYWLNQLNNNIENRSEVLMGFSESVENKALFLELTGLSY